jgi:hypothetical protein
MSTIPLDAFIRAMAKAAKVNFDRHGTVEPMFVYVDAAGDHIVLSLAKVWNDDDKEPAFAFARNAAQQAGATRCAFICEAWSLDSNDVGKPAVLKSLRNHGGLADVPGRREHIVIIAEDQTEPGRRGDMEVVRPVGRKPYLLALRIEQYLASVGRAVGFLPARGNA